MHSFSNPNFLSVVIGGGWYAIKLSIITDVPGYGRGFTWRPPIRASSDVVLIAGDIRGNATGGGMVLKVGSGTPFTNLTSPFIGDCPQNGTELTYPAVKE